MCQLQRKEQEAGSAGQDEKEEDASGRTEVKEVFVCILNSRRLLSLIVLRVALHRGAGNTQKVRAEQ